MTKLFISADLEGVCGVTSPLQCFPQPDRPAYDTAVAQLAREVSAVAETALDCGVETVIVNDSHGYMTNLTLGHLSDRVHLLSGKPKRCAMSAGLDADCDAALYIGYHAKAGTERGILNHTFHSKLFDVQVNGVSLGETGVNAYYASLQFGVPVILVSGDEMLCREAQSLIPTVETVQTKVSLSTTAALTRPEGEVLAEYRQKTQALLVDPTRWRENLLTLPPPYTLEVTFINSLCGDVASTLPGVIRRDGRTVLYQTDCFQTLYQALQSLYAMLSYTDYME